MKALTRIALHTLFLLMLYSMVRLLFWRANAIIFHDAESLAILKALVMGMRYDLAAIAITNLAIYLIFLLLARPTHKGYWFGLASLLINGFALALNMVDLEYFKFTGKRMTLEVFSMQQDIKTQAGQIALYYWYYSLIILVFFILCAWVGGRILRKTEQESLGSVCLSLLVLGAGGGLAARGGWQVKPLIPAQAFVDSDSQLGVLVLNSTFTILKSWNKDAVEELHLLPWDQVQQIVTQPRADGPAWTGKAPKNIVLVVMESFGWEYVFPPENRPSYTPFI